MHVSEIRVKRIRVNQGLGVLNRYMVKMESEYEFTIVGLKMMVKCDLEFLVWNAYIFLYILHCPSFAVKYALYIVMEKFSLHKIMFGFELWHSILISWKTQWC